MVKETAPQYVAEPDSADLQTVSTTVNMSDVLRAGLRFEAAAFALEAREVAARLKKCELPLQALYGNGRRSPVTTVSQPTRARRVYVRPEYGLPFLSSSDIISLKPEPEHWLSRKLMADLDSMLIRRGDVLVSRSGTVGNVSLAGRRIEGMALSEHALRLSCSSIDEAGYVAAFLRSRYGRAQLKHSSYGSVVVHIEPEHLERIVLPDIPNVRKLQIGEMFVSAADARDNANDLLDEADELLASFLGLPRFEDLNETWYTPIRSRDLQGRLDAAFFAPLATQVSAALRRSSAEITTLSDPRVASEIRAVTKFRKRIYVRRGGIPLLTSKQLFQIDPIGLKSIARGAHLKDMPEIGLEPDMIAVTCSGTIGRVQIIPSYMNGWAASQDALRIVAASSMNPGYVYTWLASAAGYALVTRHTYGSVIVHIDRDMLGSTPIPLLHANQMNEIGDRVLKANGLRNEAWQKEQRAIDLVQTIIEGKPVPPK